MNRSSYWSSCANYSTYRNFLYSSTCVRHAWTHYNVPDTCILFGAQRREDKQASAECDNASAMSSTSAVPAHSLPTPAKGKDDDCCAIMHAYMHTLQSYSFAIRLSICATPDFAPMIFRPLAALVAFASPSPRPRERVGVGRFLRNPWPSLSRG